LLFLPYETRKEKAETFTGEVSFVSESRTPGSQLLLWGEEDANEGVDSDLSVLY
jgi:hypothetical protein